MRARGCPTGKPGYASQTAANLVMLRAWKKYDGEKRPVRSYLCSCGRWHLTSMETPPTGVV